MFFSREKNEGKTKLDTKKLFQKKKNFPKNFLKVLLGAKYSTPADMWSLACLVFELATGDLLFDPRAGKDYERDDDHLALVSELCGRVPKRVWSAGKRGKDFFTRTGELRRIRKLRFWPLDAVLREKYGFSREEVRFFLVFFLDLGASKRKKPEFEGKNARKLFLPPSDFEKNYFLLR